MSILLMGVSGSGKTTVGKLLAARIGYEFCDADDLHPAANIEKMANGVALSDDDRAPWLEAVRDRFRLSARSHRSIVIACSALKARYRDFLLSDQIRLVYLKGDHALVARRIAERREHFMKPEMLQSQFDALEEPTEALIVEIDKTPEAIVEAIAAGLGLADAGQN